MKTYMTQQENERQKDNQRKSRDNFLIDCKNRECTCIGYDLKDIIWSMLNGHVETEEGDLDCKGSEAPDHLYQSCGSSLHYKVSIVYKD